MTPTQPDRDVIRNRLTVIEGSLDVLATLGDVTADRLRTDPVVAAAVERLLSRVVDQAVEINSHIAAARLGRAPSEYRESFRLLQSAGVLPADLTDELMRSVAMRNVIVHGYIDLDVDLVAAAVPLARDQYRQYVTAIAAFLLSSEPPSATTGSVTLLAEDDNEHLSTGHRSDAEG